LAANRMDLYRDLLEQALPRLDDKWQADLIAAIQEAIQ